ncbi:MAG: alanine/ornithine racemase family PLP-dependent enzyme [Defluviitaleaceae bacterium]|nr:alanine/ornithine racemase family PLP-dependent enzyme [Defluviitaleaceae bacterium]
MNPKLIIDLKKLKHNGLLLAEMCGLQGISVTAVTKVFCAYPEMVEVLADLPIDYLADSRIENIMAYPKGITQKTMLLRLPSPSDADRVVEYCNISLNSEIYTLDKLNQTAQKLDKIHSVILMIDLGDLREGIFFEDTQKIENTAGFILSCKNLELLGIGTNLTCYGAVLPTQENLDKLVEIADNLRKRFGIDLPVISGGNSSSLYLLENGKMPAGINHLRLGEAIVCGRETAFGETFKGLKTDVVTLQAEIIEIQQKPSMPVGRTNVNAFGEAISFKDKGVHKRGILAIGRQDIGSNQMVCHDPSVEAIDSSSDHLIVDLTGDYNVGDWLSFSLTYGGILAGFTSKYVDKIFTEEDVNCQDL